MECLCFSKLRLRYLLASHRNHLASVLINDFFGEILEK